MGKLFYTTNYERRRRGKKKVEGVSFSGRPPEGGVENASTEPLLLVVNSGEKGSHFGSEQ